MREFGHQTYVASLHSRQGEFDAVEGLADDIRAAAIPLWEILPADETEHGEPTTALDPVISGLPNKIHQASKGLECFLDCALLDPSRRMKNGDHPIRWLCNELYQRGTPVTPAVAIDSDADYLSATRVVHAAHNSDIAIRLTISDLTEIVDITDLIKQLDVGYSSLHLIVDCKNLDAVAAPSLPGRLTSEINGVLALGPWKTLTILSGSIPEDYSAISPGLTLLPRLEWPLWLALVAIGVLTHRPAFGDYAIAHPVYSYVPWWMGASSAAKIRYTGINDYHIFRGHSLKSAKYGKFSQFFGLAAAVVAHPVFRGAAYSVGDKRIADCAAKAAGVGTGNLQTWVEVSVSQHVTFLARTVPTIP